MPGIPSTARKTNTPARASMMVSPAPRDRPAKTLSPRLVEGVDPPSSGGIGSPVPPVSGLLVVTTSSFLTCGDPRRFGRSGSGRTGQGSLVSRVGSGGSASGDLRDDVLGLAGQVGVERRGAGLLCG